MRKIYQSSRFYDKNAFRKYKTYIFQILAVRTSVCANEDAMPLLIQTMRPRLEKIKTPRCKITQKQDFETNHKKMLPKFQDQDKIFQDPIFFSRKIMTSFSSDEHVLIFYSMYSTCKI